MRIRLWSDLHLEQYRDRGTKLIQSLPSGNDVDVLALAGDICYLKESYWVKEIYRAFCDKYKDVVMVPGNHSFYTSSPKTCWDNLLAAKSNIPNLHVLDLGRVEEIQGRRWIGGTLWFQDDPTNKLYSTLLNDFYLIRGFVPWVYEQCDQTMRGLKVNMEPGDIVMTHHLPSPLSIHPQYRTSSLNRFFLCDMSELILERKPNVWLHGHTHEAMEYTLGSTRVYCNPRGYLNEKKATPPFNHSLIIEV